MCFLFFIVGICIGSFLNVCIYRIPQGKSISKPRSACPKCNTQLKSTDLIPIFSWLFLKGKCRYCRTSIPPRYSLVELLTGLLFVLAYIKYGLVYELYFVFFILSILVVVVFIDLDHMIIPNEIVLTGILGGIVVFVYNIFIGYNIYPNNYWWQTPLGMVSASSILFIVTLISLFFYNEGGMGMGDVKILLPIGMFLGWKLALLALILSIFIGGFAGVYLMITKKKEKRQAIPFGPYIAIGTIFSILVGNEIIIWYFGKYILYNM